MEQVEKPSAAFQLWRESGAFTTLVPSLEKISDVDLRTIDWLPLPGGRRASQRRMLRLIALFAAAPHGAVPAILKSLRFSNAEAAWIGSILSAWNSLKNEMREAMLQQNVSDSALRKWAAVAGRTRLASVLRLAHARWCAERDAGTESPDPEYAASVYRRALRIAYRDPIEVGDLAVNGRDLEKAGFTGPTVGRTLRSLLELVINDPSLNTRDRLVAELDAMKSRTADPRI
jgi:hypothetical protein